MLRGGFIKQNSLHPQDAFHTHLLIVFKPAKLCIPLGQLNTNRKID